MTCSIHLKALLKKNWILWKRGLFCSLLEIIVPALFVFLLLALRKLVETTEIPRKSYLATDLYDFSLSAWKNAAAPENIGVFGQNDSRNNKRELDIARSFLRDCKSESRHGLLGLAPVNEITMEIEKYFKGIMEVKYFENNNAISEYIQSAEYGSDPVKHPFLCFAAVVNKNQVGNYDYRIRFNCTGLDTDVYNTVETKDRTAALKIEDWESARTYIENGFIRLQTLIDNIILQKETNSKASINTKTTSLPVPKFIKDDLPLYIKNSSNLFIVLPMMLIFMRVLYRILYEKERKIKEGMKIMGMSNTPFYLSWIITYVIIFTVLTSIETVLLKFAAFTQSNWFLIWIWVWLFLHCLLFQALFISVFFTRMKSGLIGGTVFFVLLYLMNVFVGMDVPDSTKIWASFSSHTAMSYSSDSFIIAESRKDGIQMETAQVKVNGYAYATAIIALVLNIIVYLILFLYLDQVFPNEFGKKKPPLFFLDYFKNRSKIHNIRTKEQTEEREELHDYKENVEEVDEAHKELERQKRCIAIRNLYKVYPNGKKAVNNLSLTMYDSQIFILLGHNGAGKTTTISMLIGMLEISSGSAQVGEFDVQSEMKNIRRDLGVCPQHDILFDDLTVKEHLELYAAFKGMKPQDIPPAIDKMIKELDFVDKKNFIAKNLSGGQKRKLSVAIAFIGGSKIIILDEPTSGMDTSARRHIWEILKNYKQDKIVILTTHFMDEADFLGDRIAIMGDGQLKCCGSSLFLKNKFGIGYNLTVVKEDMTENPKIAEFVKKHVPEAKVLSEVSAEAAFQLPLTSASKFKRLFQELDKSLGELGILSYGISITTLEEVFLKVAKENKKNLNQAESLNPMKGKVDDFDLNNIRIKSQRELFFVHFRALIVKKLLYSKRDKKGLFLEMLLPVILMTVCCAVLTIKLILESPPLELLPSIYSTPLPTVYSGSASEFLMHDIMKEMDPNLRMIYHKETAAQQWDDYIFDKRNSEQRGAFFIQEADRSSQTYSYISLFNSTSPDSVAIFINRLNLAIMKYATGNKNFRLSVVNEPLPMTRTSKELENTVSSVLAVVVFVLILSFIQANQIGFIIRERQFKIKHQQMISGVSLLAYWLSNLFVDFCKYLIPAIWGVLMTKAFSITIFVVDDSWGVTWLLFILFGLAAIPFTYLISFLFKEYGSGQMMIIFVNMILGAILSMSMWFLRLLPSSRNFAKRMHFFLRIFPVYCYGYGILNLSNRQLYANIEGYFIKKDSFDLEIAGYDLLYMAVFSFVNIVLIFVIEKLQTIPSLNRIFLRGKSISYQIHPYDDDVMKEMDAIEKLGDEKDYSIKVKNLRKVFSLGAKTHKVAVDRVSFGIKNGECFALLGINGAGKSTTFKMLTGEITPTSGNAYIVGYDINSQIQDARNYIGYCPQFDALLDNLTAKEHLYLYAALKGIPSHMRKEIVEKKLDEMDIRKYENIVAGTYSGGNKRKLSVAIAMLGNPPIVFLDEPSTGMDPQARRFMWDVISSISALRKHSSVLLTTHSMEEAEALATRIAIMVNGEFKCLGTVQHIKNKFGKGYEIELKTIIPTNEEVDSVLSLMEKPRGFRISIDNITEILLKMEAESILEEIKPEGTGSTLFIELHKPHGMAVEVLAEYYIIQKEYGPKIMSFITEELGSFTVIEHFNNFYRFKLDTVISIGAVFGAFEDEKDNLKISQYSVKQATIEQIFNLFATGQIKDPTAQEKRILKKMSRSFSRVMNRSITKGMTRSFTKGVTRTFTSKKSELFDVESIEHLEN